MENTALLSLHSIQNPLKSKAGCSSQDSNRIKFPELCLFVVYEKRRRNGVSYWKRKKTRRGYTMSNDNVIAFQPTET
ncbi:MAG: hypothetical protein K6T90_21320, partial [Leptolyngbyaceae cyanobacterium HOT.MB2.61]|nr:hypothetical protein [Leptolyngbyaceae cyanobacterium HOT.MB2.61]